VEFPGSQEQADEFAFAALKRMKRLGIAPHPNNFILWYSYFAGTPPELVRTLDALQGTGQAFGEELNRELHARFFGSQEAAAIKASERIEVMVERVLSLIGAAGEDAQRYDDALKRFEGGLKGESPAKDLRSLVNGIIAETRRMAEQNHTLEGALSRSSQEIEALRQDLVNTQLEALTDALTGIGNRKYLDLELRRAVAETMESGGELSLIMADIDRFKRFNDRHGHQIGDELLKIVARALKDQVKGRDIVARYGGEEFSIVLPRTGLENACKLAEQIRVVVAGRRIIKKATGEDYGVVTLSLGIAQYRLGEPIPALVGRADEALYMAKRDGRNRVVSETALEPSIAMGARA
jgi:diguanylate cyclase